MSSFYVLLCVISEIDRAFKQFVFESMDLTTTDPNGFIVTCDSEGVLHSAIPWDDPYPFFRGMIPKHPHKELIRVSPDRSGRLLQYHLWIIITS